MGDETKCGFLLYGEYEELLALLTDEECGRLFRGIFLYERTGEEPGGMTPTMKVIFTVIRLRLDANREKYRKRCERMRENGKKGGRPKSEEAGSAESAEENRTKAKESNCFPEKQSKPKETRRKQKKPIACDTDPVTDTVTVTVTDTDTDSIKDTIFPPAEGERTRTRSIPPEFSDVEAYCAELGGAVDARKFYDHYASNGWRVGKVKMQDWRAAVRKWDREERAKTAASADAGSFGTDEALISALQKTYGGNG